MARFSGVSGRNDRAHPEVMVWGGWGLGARLAPVVAGAFLLLACRPDGKEMPEKGMEDVVVIRVESPAPERAGAEHCDSAGANCRPLAPQARVPRKGLVRTLAGGRVSLDFGHGRRLDLGSLSQLDLSKASAHLAQGEFTVESVPLIEKEAPSDFVVTSPSGPVSVSERGLLNLSVTPDETLMTVRRGRVKAPQQAELEVPGQSLLLTSAGAFKTTAAGLELPALPLFAPRRSEYGRLLSESPEVPRGLGTMTARLPLSDEVRDGVVLKSHHVRVIIRDGFARTEVEEEFENTTPLTLEGRYRFAVPGDASLSRLALWVGDELVEGRIVERERAREIYTSIVDRPAPRDPALLEWVSGGEMSLKVFPILPKKSRRVVLAYEQALAMEGGRGTYVYPLSLGQGRQNRIGELSVNVELSDSQAEISQVRVLSHDAEVRREGDGFAASFVQKEESAARDFVVAFESRSNAEARLSTDVASLGPAVPGLLSQAVGAASEPPLPQLASHQKRVPAVAGTQAAGNQAALGRFSLRLTADLPEGQKRPSFQPLTRAIVLDVSYSQSEETIRAQGAVAFGMLREMNEGERFVLLACDSACAAHRSGEGLVASLPAALQFLESLRPGGSSDTAGALLSAAAHLRLFGPSEGRRKQVVFLSDGQTSSGELTPETISARVRSEVRSGDFDLSFIGIGRTVDDDSLLALASRLDGSYQHLGLEGSLESSIDALTISLRAPLIRSPEVSLPEGLRSHQAGALPALRLGQEVILVGEVDALVEGVVILSGRLGDADFRLRRDVTWNKRETAQNPLVSRLWARSRISELEAQVSTPQLEKEIVSLSRQYGTMSRLTSFLALENEEMYRKFGLDDDAMDKEAEHKVPAPEPVLFRRERMVPPPVSIGSPQQAESLSELEGVGRDEAPPASQSRSRAPFPSGPTADWSSHESAPIFGDLGASRGSGSAGSSRSAGLPGESEVARPSSAPAPRPAPPAAMKPKAPPKKSSGAQMAPSDLDGAKADSKLAHHYAPTPRRAHLVFSAADDAWRSWAEDHLAGLSESLSAQPQSRTRHESYILGHLGAGRFREARQVAEDFLRLDPDHGPAHRLLAYASVLDGDHERARQMLDVETESSPRDSEAHAQAARAFEAVGDQVRACAHYRALHELSPNLDEITALAQTCLMARGASTPAAGSNAREEGLLKVSVECAENVPAVDCPSPVVVMPDGRVVSPWTPGVAASTKGHISLMKVSTGTYWVLVVGGAPSAEGSVKLTGRHEATTLRFSGGGLHTVGRVAVSFW